MPKQRAKKNSIGEVNAASIKKAVEARKPEKVKATFYLEKDVYEVFQDNCKGAELIVSAVVEELMRSFNRSSK